MKAYFFSNKIRPLVTLAFLLTTLEQKISAQFEDDYNESPFTFETGGSIGIMNCLTDLGGNRGPGKASLKDFNLGNSHLNGSIYITALYKKTVGLRVEATLGRVSAYDSILKPVLETAEGRYQRNLNFRSKINELTFMVEFHPLPIFRNQDNPPGFSPYITAGAGFFSFNPQAIIGNNWIDLHPLTLEGQGFSEYPERIPYQLTGINVPVGLGIKYRLSPALHLRAEFIHRILSTDYLDDVSTRYINADLFQKYYTGVQLQNARDLSSNDRVNPGGPTGIYRKAEGGIRGNPEGDDAYFTFNLKLGIQFGRSAERRNSLQRDWTISTF